jgi:hypothetical protein
MVWIYVFITMDQLAYFQKKGSCNLFSEFYLGLVPHPW